MLPAFLLIQLLLASASALTGVDYGKPSLKEGLTDAEKTLLLNLHNKYRQLTALGNTFNKPQAANMMKLVI